MTTQEIQKNIELYEKLTSLILNMLDELRRCKYACKRQELVSDIEKLQRRTTRIANKFEVSDGK